MELSVITLGVNLTKAVKDLFFSWWNLRTKRGRLYAELVEMYAGVAGLLKTIEMNPKRYRTSFLEAYEECTKSEYYHYIRKDLDTFYSFKDRKIIDDLYMQFLEVMKAQPEHRQELAAVAVRIFEEDFKGGILDRKLIKYAAQKHRLPARASNSVLWKKSKNLWEVLEIIDRGDWESILNEEKHFS